MRRPLGGVGARAGWASFGSLEAPGQPGLRHAWWRPIPRPGPRSSGSVLALVPAGFLVLVLLAALAVDSAVSYLGQRQLHDAFAAAANDAVAAAVDNANFYGHGVVSLDPTTLDSVICRSLTAQNASQLRGVSVGVAVAGDSVEVAGTATVGMVFGRPLPGFASRHIRASAVATLESTQSDAAPPAFGPPLPLPCNLS